jgi:hypothetical protein
MWPTSCSCPTSRSPPPRELADQGRPQSGCGVLPHRRVRRRLTGDVQPVGDDDELGQPSEPAAGIAGMPDRPDRPIVVDEQLAPEPPNPAAWRRRSPYCWPNRLRASIQRHEVRRASGRVDDTSYPFVNQLGPFRGIGGCGRWRSPQGL